MIKTQLSVITHVSLDKYFALHNREQTIAGRLPFYASMITGVSNSGSKSMMISKRQVRDDAGVLLIRRGADHDANVDSALI